MRFAFKTSPQYTNWSDLRAVWSAADDIETFESGWLFDHFYPIPQPGRDFPADGPCLEGWSVLAALAALTQRLRLGVLVTGVHYRNLGVLAKMITTVDHISNGRLEIGLGAGWNELESKAFGIRLGGPAERSDRFEEGCEALGRLLSEETTTYEGRYQHLVDARCNPPSVQRPRPPLVIGGNGERRTLRTAARFADHWNYLGLPPDGFARKRDVLYEHCAAVGRDPSEITLSSHVWMRDGSASALDEVVRTIELLAPERLDLAIVYVLPPLDVRVLEPLASRPANLGGAAPAAT
jgi:F420-dependent oxidoreductase-like protein